MSPVRLLTPPLPSTWIVFADRMHGPRVRRFGALRALPSA